MAWSWSHSAEAYDNLYQNLHNPAAISIEDLRIVYAEWMATGRDEDGNIDSDDFDSFLYNKMLEAAQEFDRERLADSIYTFAEEFATCTNGGHQAWICPHGCHLLSFDLIPQEEPESNIISVVVKP